MPAKRKRSVKTAKKSLSNISNLQTIKLPPRFFVFTALFIVGFSLTYSTSTLFSDSKTIISNNIQNILPIKKKPYLSLVSDTQSIKAGKEFKVSLTIDPQTNNIDAGDIFLVYDQNVLEPTQLKEGLFFDQYPIKDTYKGYVRITGIKMKKDDASKNNPGEIAEIAFTAVKEADRTIISVDNAKSVLSSDKKNIFDINSKVFKTVAINK